jgi:hypothetical protein
MANKQLKSLRKLLDHRLQRLKNYATSIRRRKSVEVRLEKTGVYKGLKKRGWVESGLESHQGS